MNNLWYMQFNPRMVKFKNLTLPYQLSIIQWMAVDGTKWKLKDNAVRPRKKHVPEIVAKHGNKVFGVVVLPLEEIAKRIMEDLRKDPDEELKTFRAYHKWYMEAFDSQMKLSNHPPTNRWPCILPSNEDEEDSGPLADGFHRLHRYIEQGAKVIPCVFFP